MSQTSTTRVAIVTGAAQGLGANIALRLADDGLDVAVNDIGSKGSQLEEIVAQIKAKGRRAISVPADVSSDADVQAMVAKVVKELGGLDVMVANAGIVQFKPLLETGVDEWDRMLAINLRGVMLCYKYSAIQMIKQGRGGRLIAASSMAGKRGMIRLPSYSAAKFAVRGLTQSAALELAPHKITVNAYCPGGIKTPMGSGARAATEESKLPANMPFADPEVIGSIVSYLAKPESYFITGQSILVDGGCVFD
ncbi:hypothetical protein AcW1_001809 [Taiwanofungus camphoratus]|nr:hypothetical protein AcV5_000141 [Antrodia cinnamomea]KAI0945017.1 hypothetical protein AcV7_001663 [Antrodia cinnamomea]KAI0945633.1 hypothetical protein AcW1_001809 [Antrodia cinnamomea]